MYQKSIYGLALLLICNAAGGSEREKKSRGIEKPGAVPIVAEAALKPLSVTLNLTNMGDAVARLNPDLMAARLRIEEARARVRQAGLLSNPQLSTRFQQEPSFRELGGGVGFSQAFPVTARLRLEKEVTTAEVAVAEAEVGDVERRFTGEARRLAVQFLALQQQKELRSRQLKLARDLADYTDKVAQKGEASPLDAAQVKLEADQFGVEIRQLDIRAQQLIGRLKPLVGLAPDDTLTLDGSLGPAKLPAMTPSDPLRRKDYEAAQLAVIAAGRAVKLEEAKRWGDITAGLFASFSREEDDPIGLEAEHRVGFQISIPLPIWNKNKGAIAEREAREKRLELSVATLANRIRNEVQTAYQTMDTQASLAREIETGLLPGSQRQVENTATAYRNGFVNLLTVLRTRDQYLRLQSAHLDARRDFHLARVRYETALGKTR